MSGIELILRDPGIGRTAVLPAAEVQIIFKASEGNALSQTMAMDAFEALIEHEIDFHLGIL